MSTGLSIRHWSIPSHLLCNGTPGQLVLVVLPSIVGHRLFAGLVLDVQVLPEVVLDAFGKELTETVQRVAANLSLPVKRIAWTRCISYYQSDFGRVRGIRVFGEFEMAVSGCISQVRDQVLQCCRVCPKIARLSLGIKNWFPLGPPLLLKVLEGDVPQIVVLVFRSGYYDEAQQRVGQLSNQVHFFIYCKGFSYELKVFSGALCKNQWGISIFQVETPWGL